MKYKIAIISGLIFAVIDVLLMIPLEFSDKTAAMTGAFVNRFAIGFLIPLVTLPFPLWFTGGFLGLLLSLPDAIITYAYAPIIGTGIVGGVIIGWITQRLLSKK